MSDLGDERVAVVGAGGTGSHILDFISKTAVRQVHVFDAEDVEDKNISRIPGPPPGRRDPGLKKARFHAARYRGAVTGYDEHIDEANIHRLLGYDTVFLCFDGQGPLKRRIIDACMSKGVLLIDVGLSAGSSRDTSLIGGSSESPRCCRGSTTMPNDVSGSTKMMSTPRAATNRRSELNALNAALAVVRWKKLKGVYDDLGGELDCLYDLADNSIDNTETRITATTRASVMK